MRYAIHARDFTRKYNSASVLGTTYVGPPPGTDASIKKRLVRSSAGIGDFALFYNSALRIGDSELA